MAAGSQSLQELAGAAAAELMLHLDTAQTQLDCLHSRFVLLH